MEENKIPEEKKGRFSADNESPDEVDLHQEESSAFELDYSDEDAFGDVKESIDTNQANANVGNLIEGNQDKADDKKENTKKERTERRKKFFLWGFLIFVVLLTALAIILGSLQGEEPEEVDEGDIGVGDPDSLPNEISDNTEYAPPPPVVSDNADQAAIPVEKDDYARYNNTIVSEGLAQWAEVYNTTRGGSEEDPSLEYSIGNFGSNAQETDVDDVENPAALRELIETSTTANSVGGYAANFPSRYEGYTNFVGDSRLSDGTHNPMYSFVLREDILFAFGHHVERLINPVYGNWWIWQHGGEEASNNIELFLFRDMFTPQWWEENITNGQRSNLPVLADWNHNDYGRDDLWDGIRWVGEVVSNDTTTVQTHNGTSFDIHSEMEVLFTAYTDTGNTIERTGKLTIVLTPNYSDDNVINYRLLISEASLVMDEE